MSGSVGMLNQAVSDMTNEVGVTLLFSHLRSTLNKTNKMWRISRASPTKMELVAV